MRFHFMRNENSYHYLSVIETLLSSRNTSLTSHTHDPRFYSQQTTLPAVVAHICKPSTQEAQAGGLKIQGLLLE